MRIYLEYLPTRARYEFNCYTDDKRYIFSIDRRVSEGLGFVTKDSPVELTEYGEIWVERICNLIDNGYGSPPFVYNDAVFERGFDV